MNVNVIQPGRGDLAARTLLAVLRIAGVPGRPHRRAELVAGTTAAIRFSGKSFRVVTQCPRNLGSVVCWGPFL